MNYSFVGAKAEDRAGLNVTMIADIDGDGQAEIVISAPNNAGTAPGEVYVILSSELVMLDTAGGGAGDGIIDLGDVGTHGGIVIEGHYVGSNAGFGVAGAGDLDGDGSEELLIGSLGNLSGSGSAGAVFLLPGDDTMTPENELDLADGTEDGRVDLGALELTGDTYRFSATGSSRHVGWHVEAIGDLDGDGDLEFALTDHGVLIGDGGQGAVYIVSQSDLETLDLAGLDDNVISVSHIGPVAGYRFDGPTQNSLTGIFVVPQEHGDGSVDLLIGAPSEFAPGLNRPGVVYLIRSDELATLDGNGDRIIELEDVAPSGGYRLEGAGALDYTGRKIAGDGDADNDGRGDLLISAQRVGGADHGVVYLVHDQDLAELDSDGDGVIDLADVGQTGLDGKPLGYQFVGQASQDNAGTDVAFVGDIDGDGLDDFIITATGANLAGLDSGAIYVVYSGDLELLDGYGGAATDGKIRLADIGALQGSDRLGYKIAGQTGQSIGWQTEADKIGGSLLVGASFADVGGTDAGGAYLIDLSELQALDIADVEDGIIYLNPVCYARGTRLRTNRGEVPVEALRTGDLVWTRDAGLQPIRWIAASRHRAEGRNAPVRIRRGTFGARRDLYVSRQHRILLSGAEIRGRIGMDEVFAAAIHLLEDGRIDVVEGGIVDYFHVLLDRHHVLEAEGVAAESFYPGPQAWKMMAPAARSDLAAACPGLFEEPDSPSRGYGPLARPVLPGREARALIRGLRGVDRFRATAEAPVAARPTIPVR